MVQCEINNLVDRLGATSCLGWWLLAMPLRLVVSIVRCQESHPIYFSDIGEYILLDILGGAYCCDT